MTTTTPVRPEFTVVRRLQHLGAESQRAVVPAQRFSADLRERLVRQAGAAESRRVSGCCGG